jgi:HAD superfamily hydrolase (TIGR01450 family)
MLPSLGAKELFLFDLDGVFYKGKETRIRLGGRRTVEAIRRKGKKLLVLTNDSTDSVETVWKRLAEDGVEVEKEEILTSASLTAEYVYRLHGSVSYYLIGEPGLESEMRRLGHTRTSGEKADFVVVGLDRTLTYEKLDRAALAVRNGASIVATHAARLYMYADGPAVATGPIVKALEYATGKRATVIGKPSRLMFDMALRRAGCRREKAVMVGDQVETDVIGAARAGIDAILVTTGVDRNAEGHDLLMTIASVDDLAGLI